MILDENRRGAAVPPAAPAAPPAPSPVSSVANFGLHPSGSAVGGSGLGRSPDIPANMLGYATNMIGKYIYSFPAGGYLRPEDARNANSYYNKFGAGQGGDPNANAEMARFYAWMGGLPTKANVSPALQRLYGSHPDLARAAPTGPSYNETLGEIMRGPVGGLARQAGFGPVYRGPFQFGQRNPDYTSYGQYRPNNQYESNPSYFF